MASPTELAYTAVISLDIGSTFSSAAWAIISEDQAGIVDVLNQQTINKSPTRLGSNPVRYLDNAHPLGARETPIELFKLLLAPDRHWRGTEEDAAIVTFVENIVASSGYTGAMDHLMYTFVRGLWNDAFGAVRRANGHITRENQVTTVVTYPYIFRGEPLRRFKDIVNMAIGDERLEDPSFLTENCAAVLGVVDPASGRIQHGDIVMVVDCGGISIDGSYTRFESFLEHPEDTLEIPYHSRLAGGVYADHLFEQLLDRKFPNATCQMLREAKAELLRRWRVSFKHDFTGILNDRQLSAELGSNGEHVDITNDEMKSDVFNPVIDIINNVIQELQQRARNDFGMEETDPLSVVLTGGLSRSRYIRSKLKTENRPLNVNVLDIGGTSNIVVNGALAWKLDEIKDAAAAVAE